LIYLITSFLWLIAPKITIFNLPGYTQGIRLEDIFFIFILIHWFFLNNRIKYKIKFPIIGGTSGLILIAYILFFEIISIFYLKSPSSNLIFGMRWAEYLIMGSFIFHSAILYTKYYIKLIKFYIIFNLIFSIIFILKYGLNYRYSGLTEGPWEICSVLTFLYMGLYKYIESKERVIFFCAVFFVCIASQARIQLISLVPIIILLFNINIKKLALFVPVVILFYYGISNEILTLIRFDSFSIDSINNLITILIEGGRDLKWEDVSKTADVDSSTLSRLIIWLSFIYPWIDAGLYGILFGIGAGTGGVVVDGFYIRLITEFGIVGILFFIKWILKIIDNYEDLKINHTIILIFSIISLTNDPITSQRIFSSFVLAVSLNKKFKLNNNFHFKRVVYV